MSKDEFDDIIKSKLQDYRSTGKPDWKAFKTRQSQNLDQGFDGKIAAKLSAYEAKSADADWNSFAQRYQVVRHLVQNIRSVKFVEACIMLLLIFGITFIEDFRTDNAMRAERASNESAFQNRIDPNSAERLAQIEHEVKAVSGAEIRYLRENQHTNKIKSGSHGASGKASNKDQKKTYSTGKDLSKQENDRQTASSETSAATSGSALNTRDNGKVNETMLPLNPQHTSRNSTIEKRIKTHIQAPELLEGVPISQSWLKGFKTPPVLSLEYTLTNKPDNASVRREGQWLSLYTSFNNNQIFSPADPEFNTKAQHTEMHGFGIGLLSSRKKAGFEWATGLVYSSFNKPWDFNQQYNSTNGWYSFIMTNIHYKLLSIPLSLNYHLVETRDWSLLAIAGLSNTFIAHAEYQKTNTYLGGGSVTPGGQNLPPSGGVSPFENERPFTKGLFQGEDIANTYFLRGFIGTGIQRNINPATAIVFTVNYYKSIINTEIGPNNDRLDKFNISFSLKMRMR